MKTGNKQTLKSLIDDVSRLHKDKESILIPFVISSIPTKIMEAFTECLDYFVSSSVVSFYDGKRNLTLNLNRRFPIKEKNNSVFWQETVVSVPPGTFEKIERINLLICNKSKLVNELQKNIQLASCC